MSTRALVGPLVRQAAKGTSVIPTSTPTPTPTDTATATPTSTNTLPPTDCAGRPDGSTCDAGLDFGNTLLCVDGECVACSPDGGATPRFVDNGDGTISDRRTCLVWEKKDDSGGIHDKDNNYTFSIQREFPIRDGTVFTEFLTGLNTTIRFAGHGDWRVPTTDGLAGGVDAFPTGEAPEVESLHDGSVPGCAVVASCIAPGFDVNCGSGSSGNPGCTVDGMGGEECSCTPYEGTQSDYWTNSTADPLFFGRGFTASYTLAASVGLSNHSRYTAESVRAVRGGVVFIP